VLKGFNILAGTNLQVLVIAVRQCDITHSEQLQTAITLHYITLHYITLHFIPSQTACELQLMYKSVL
jgi:hypothetical protein